MTPALASSNSAPVAKPSRGSFASQTGPHMRESELYALAALATLAQISTPSAAHFLKSHRILMRKFAADRDRQKAVDRGD
jgi:hypothetical protein